MDNEAKKDSKLKQSFGWGKNAYKIIMKNKLVIAGCLLVQGLIYLLRPHHVLVVDVRIMTGLTMLYALVSMIFVLSDGKKAEKSKEVVGGWYKDFWSDKQEQLRGPGEKLSDNELIDRRLEAAQARDEKLKAYAEEKKKRRAEKKWLVIATYLVLIAVCIPLFFFATFTDHVVHMILGVVVVIEGVFTLITAVMTKETVRPRDRVVSMVIAIFSIVLGCFLMLLPSETAAFVMRIVGLGFIIKAIAELIVGFRNRSLIVQTKETISEIKEL